MPRIRGLKSRVPEIDVEIRHWSQGDLVPIPFTFAAYVPALPSTDETLKLVKEKSAAAGGTLEAEDDDIAVRDADPELWAVIATQTCDLIETCQFEPWFEIALVDQMDDPANARLPEQQKRLEQSWRRALSGANIARFAISVERDGVWSHPELGNGRWYVDLRRLLPFEKGKLLQLAEVATQPRVGVPLVLRRDFAWRLQERFGRDVLPDAVEKNFVAPLVDELVKLRIEGDEPTQEILNGLVREIRYIVEPADRQRYVVQLFVCVTADCRSDSIPSRASVESLFNEIVRRVEANARDVSAVTLRFASADLREVTAAEYRASYRLDWSARDA